MLNGDNIKLCFLLRLTITLCTLYILYTLYIHSSPSLQIAALQQQLEAMASPAARAAVMKQLASNNENQQGGSSKASAGKGSKTSPLSGGTSPSAPGGDETHKDELLKKKV